MSGWKCEHCLARALSSSSSVITRLSPSLAATSRIAVKRWCSAASR